MAFPDNLKIARERNGYSLEDIASKVHIERQTFWKYEQGISIPNAILVVDIAEALGTTVEKLVKGKTENFLSENTNN